MLPELETLRRLQAHEREVAAARARLGAMPARRVAIDAEVESVQQRLRDVQAAMDDRHARRRQGDGDVSALQARLSKYRNQLMTVNTNREYEAMQHEIDAVDGQLKAREDEVIGWLMEIDELAQQATAEEQALARARQEADLMLSEMADEERATRLELASLQGHVESERAALSAGALALYDRAARRFPLSAVAQLVGESCSGCNVRLRPMVVSDLRRGERIVLCDSCARILFVAPPKPPAPPPTDPTGPTTP